MKKKRTHRISFASKWPEHYGPEDVAILEKLPNGRFKIDFEASRGGTIYGLTAREVLAEIRRRRRRQTRTSPAIDFGGSR